MFNSPYLALILATLFWGGNLAIGKAISGVIPPMTVSYIRWVMALIIFIPFGWKEFRAHLGPALKNWWGYIVLGATGVVGCNMCTYLALEYTTAINVALINAFAPVMSGLFGLVLLREKLKGLQWLGIGLSLAGVVQIVLKGSLENLTWLRFNPGDLIMLFSIILWGIYTVVLKTKGNLLPGKALFLASTIGGLLVTTPIILFQSIQSGLDWVNHLTIYHYLSLLYFGIFPSVIALQLFNRAALTIGPSRASNYMNLVIVFATLFGVLFLGETLTMVHLIGGLLIIAGVYLTSKK